MTRIGAAAIRQRGGWPETGERDHAGIVALTLLCNN